jgi:hypothetical protein
MSPAIGEATRLKGATADISDFTLRDGKKVVIEVGASVTSAPTLVRSMESSSTMEVPVYDPSLSVLEKALLGEKFDAFIDGLQFRFAEAQKTGANLNLVFEDQVIARLRELKGPKKSFRAKMTRAKFVCGLVEELEPEVPIFCPQLEEKQPIENTKEAKVAVAKSKEVGGKGIGDTKGLKVKGQTPSPEQTELLNMALEIADSGGAPFICQVALIAALIDETDAGAVQRGNVLAALEPYTQVRDAAEEISGFLFGKPEWTGTTAVDYYNAHPEATFYEIAQGVQASETEDGSNYAAFGDEARQWVEAFGGATGGALSSGATSETVIEPYTFAVGKKETYWAAIQRLAGEVNWKAFVVEGRFFFISEPELSRGQVQLAIERKPGHRQPKPHAVQDVDFEYNQNLPTTEATLTVLAEHWKLRPGAVVTLAGYGPASIGAGDAPPEKGAKVGLSSAVKASTHEGKGRYLVSKVQVPMTDDPKTRMLTVTLMKPTQPLPEKAASTTTKSSGVSPVGSTAATTETPTLGDSSVSGHPELESGVSEVVNAILKQFPELEITSTTGGTHATNSLHYEGRAADLASGDYSLMNKAAAWINKSGLWQHLTEGIHNPGTGAGGEGASLLSVKNQQKVPSSYWGEPTWSEHLNHIHVGV